VLFQPQTLGPKASLTIQILFLPYFLTPINGLLTLTSTLGKHELTAFGRARPNAYRLHAINGRVGAGSTHAFEQPLVVYNPFDEVLQVREIFTTESFLTLRGVGGAAPLTTWTIEPHTEKELVKLR